MRLKGIKFRFINLKRIMNEQIEKRYKEIVNKLGFEPKDYEPERPKEGFTENDNRKSPFAALSLEELLFLRDNNYLLSK